MEPIGTGAAANLTSEATKGIFQIIKHHIKYVISYQENVENFEGKIETLKAKRSSVEQDVLVATNNLMKIKPDIELWRKRVDDKIEEEEKRVKDLEKKAKNKCFIGLCPNIKSRYQLSRKAEKVVTAFDELIRECQVSGGVATRDVHEATVDASPEDFDALDSRKEVFEDIMKALKDPTTSMIGVYGVGGVGKTTLVKEVARQAHETGLFDSVIMVAVGQTPNIQKIQDEIAELLDFKLEQKSTAVRASQLRKRLTLKKDKKILVVLDNIWVPLDLKEVGIPFGGYDCKGCKILLTSRDKDVLSTKMDVKTTLGIDVLEENEARDLFNKQVGEKAESPEFRSIAVEIAKRCGGLPLAIATIARGLSKKELPAWKDALTKLKRPSPSNFTGISAEVYCAIELSYNHLESEELKQTFLLCSLLGHDASIEYLLRYAMGLQLFGDVYTVEETRNRVLRLVSDLKASCLLRDCNTSNDCFDMHDVICDVALAIAARDYNVFASKDGDVPEAWPDGEKIKKCTRINLRYASIKFPDDELICPQLTFFLMAGKDYSVHIPSNFFGKMENLKVLNLTKMDFSSEALVSQLPSSISSLKSLRTLCLDICMLEDIAIIGELNNLEILSLVGSDIEMLPKEIGQLIKLRSLDLSSCSELKIIPWGVLSKLSNLEELFMGDGFVQWEVDGHANRQRNASLAELTALSKLTTLDIHVLDAQIMPKDLLFENLQVYKIFIGDEAWDLFDKKGYSRSRTLKLKLNTSIHSLVDGVKILLKKSEALYLEDLKDVKILLKELGGEGIRHLKNLHIRNGMEMKYVLDGNHDQVDKLEFLQLRSLTLERLPKLVSFFVRNKRDSATIPQHESTLFNEPMVFPCLENLHLSSINVERIWHNTISNTSECYTQKLTSLIIEGCDNLKHLLSSSMAGSLAHLKCFEIVECKCLRQVIFTEDIVEENKTMITFPQLNSLKIRNLQHLTGFCSENYNIEFPSLKLLEIEQCPQLRGFIYKSTEEENRHFSPQALFDEKVAFPSLESLSISSLRNMKMIWHNQLSVYSFCKLGKMVVEDCNELFSIFPFGMLSTIQRLQILKVSNCCSVEHIFEVQRSNMEETHVVDTQLRELHISNLPKLQNIWNNDPQRILTFQNLSVVVVFSCWSLKNVFPASVARVLPQLKELIIISCAVEEIVSKAEEWEPTVNNFEFDQMSFLSLWNLPQFKCFYPGMHTTKWPMLKRLKTYHSNKVKIFDTECLNLPDMKEGGQLESPIQPPLFLVEKVVPKLEEVSLTSDDIAIICDSKVSNGLFHEIKTLHLLCYHDKSAIFPTTFLERFNNLEKLEVICCYFEDLFSIEGGVGKGTNPQTLLPIRNLKLDGLYCLKYIWMQGSQLDRILPNLETLEVFNGENLICLGLSSTPFQNLMTLDVWKCDRMINLIPSSAVQSLVQLENLKIRNCASMKEIVGNEGDDEATYDVIFNRLKCLELRHLPSLKSFCSDNHTFGFPSLVQVIVKHCLELEIFCKGDLNAPILQRVRVNDKDEKGQWDGDLNITVQQLYTKKVDYEGMEYLVLSDFSKAMEIWRDNLQKTLNIKNLQHLEVYECNSLTYILTTSMALDLVQLEKMVVKNCLMLEQIITNDGAEEATTNTIMFPSLQIITLESCSNLTSFYLGSNVLECPFLTRHLIKDCPKMVAFASSSPREQNQKPIGIAPFFNDKVLFPRLNVLIIQGMGNLTRIWHDKLTRDSFHEITSINVKNCERLLNIFPFSMIERLDKLKQLEIMNCGSLEEIIGPHGHNSYESHEVTTSQSIAAETTAKFLFPKIELLVLNELPKLKSFYSKIHTTEWPSLQQLLVKGCNKIEIIFAGEHLNYQEMQGKSQLEIPIQQPLFWVNEDTFPCLERICLFGNYMKEIWHGRIPTQYFRKLRDLDLLQFDKSVTIPVSFIQSLSNLERLAVIDACFTQIFQCEGHGDEGNAWALAQLRELRLINLPELTTVWKEEFFYSRTAFNNLRTLKVYGCGRLKTLVPSSVSFENLTTLEVSRCDGFINLLRNSTAKSIVHLTSMSITNCQMIEEIIACTNDEVNDDAIIFSHLKHLELDSLPSLSSFCPGNYTFGFPSLEEVIISQCPKMKIFSKGKLSTQMLQGIQSTKGEYVGRWEGNLNAIVQQLFIEKVFPSLEDLELLSINIQRIWNYKLLATSSYAQNLTCLTMEGCHNLNCLFLSSMVESFVQLKMLNIENCENMEKVIFLEEVAIEEMMSKKLFHRLELLLLKYLPKLTRFCDGNYFEFPLLRILRIERCSTLKTFILDAEGNSSEIASPILFNEKVGFPCLEELSIIGVGNWREIWPDGSTNSVRIQFANC